MERKLSITKKRDRYLKTRQFDHLHIDSFAFTEKVKIGQHEDEWARKTLYQNYYNNLEVHIWKILYTVSFFSQTNNKKQPTSFRLLLSISLHINRYVIANIQTPLIVANGLACILHDVIRKSSLVQSRSWQQYYLGQWPKKGTPLRFRVKKGHNGNEILESEKSSQKNIFECSSWVARKRLYVFGQKGYNPMGEKGTVQHEQKKGYTSRFRAKKGHTVVNVCRAELKMRQIFFFGPKPQGCTLFWPSP